MVSRNLRSRRRHRGEGAGDGLFFQPTNMGEKDYAQVLRLRDLQFGSVYGEDRILAFLIKGIHD